VPAGAGLMAAILGMGTAGSRKDLPEAAKNGIVALQITNPRVRSLLPVRKRPWKKPWSLPGCRGEKVILSRESVLHTVS